MFVLQQIEWKVFPIQTASSSINILYNFLKAPLSDSDMPTLWSFNADLETLLKPNFPRLIAKQINGLLYQFQVILSNLEIIPTPF